MLIILIESDPDNLIIDVAPLPLGDDSATIVSFKFIDCKNTKREIHSLIIIRYVFFINAKSIINSIQEQHQDSSSQ